MIVSVVVPTYNRGAKLRDTVRPILESDLGPLRELEVIVVDDGSKEPAEPYLADLEKPLRVSLRTIRQANAGPAAARNRGAAEARGDIVLFIDDDIFVPSDLILNHVQAHAERPGAVIFGRCPFANATSALQEYLAGNGSDPTAHSRERYVSTPVVASGQISFERALISSLNEVYRSDLITPAAEEFELSARLSNQTIPIYIAPWIVAIHGQEVELRVIALQQYKHAVGCAEAALKCPETLRLEQLARVIERNRGIRSMDPVGLRISKGMKSVISSKAARAATLKMTLIVEKHIRNRAVLSRLYRWTFTAYFCAGVRDGLKRFSLSN